MFYKKEPKWIEKCGERFSVFVFALAEFCFIQS